MTSNNEYSNIYPSAPFIPATNPEIDNVVPIRTNIPYTTHPHPVILNGPSASPVQQIPQQMQYVPQPQYTQQIIPPKEVILRVDTSFVPIDKATNIISYAKSDMVLSLPEGKNMGEMAILWSKEKGADFQRFTFTTDGFIQSVNNPHLVLDHQNAIQGSTIVLSLKKEETDRRVLTQKWNVEKSGLKNSVVITTALDHNLVLELPGSQQKGMPLYIAPRQLKSQTQSWNLDSKSLKVIAPINVDVYMQHASSGNYMDVPGGKVGEAKLVIVHPGKLVFNTNQRWKLSKDGFIHTCLDPEYVLTCSSGAPGDRVYLSKKRAPQQNMNQRWMVVQADNAPHVYIVSMLNPYVLLDQVEGALQLSQNTLTKNSNIQRWFIKSA